ncbi:hypothetical protein D3877_27135 [Azospirillum cavernae]|uniref:Uncharacterized protein n=1 Tax=Azospirillum cavernae TaxID=2320860 RepID=A0A418VMW6_9PROT|nr:hypothetical protein D3877_27135 [Azospirillum cavernae]
MPPPQPSPAYAGEGAWSFVDMRRQSPLPHSGGGLGRGQSLAAKRATPLCRSLSHGIFRMRISMLRPPRVPQPGG